MNRGRSKARHDRGSKTPDFVAPHERHGDYERDRGNPDPRQAQQGRKAVIPGQTPLRACPTEQNRCQATPCNPAVPAAASPTAVTAAPASAAPHKARGRHSSIHRKNGRSAGLAKNPARTPMATPVQNLSRRQATKAMPSVSQVLSFPKNSCANGTLATASDAAAHRERRVLARLAADRRLPLPSGLRRSTSRRNRQ